MSSNFGDAIAYMLPVCTYTKHKSFSQSGPRATISDITLTGKSSSATGVDLRWYTKKEYTALSPEQKKELFLW